MITSLNDDSARISNTKLLVIADREFSWLGELTGFVREVETINTKQSAESLLSQSHPDIILYHSGTFDETVPQTLDYLRLLAPKAIISVIMTELSFEQYDHLLELGAHDVILSDTDDAAMVRHIYSLIRRSNTRHEMAFRTRKLHAINQLSQRLQNAEHPTALIVEAIEFICDNFGIHGVAMAFDRGSAMHLYGGKRDVNNRRRLYESQVMLEAGDPMRQVMKSNMSLIFDDIKRHPYFTPIPVIENPGTALIVPIRESGQIIGSLALFADKTPFSTADVAIFELLAGNIGTAYQNITQYYWHEVEAQTMRQVLRAWSELNAVFERSAIAERIHDAVIDVENVHKVGIWFFPTASQEAVIYSGEAELSTTMQELLDKGALEGLQKEFDNGLRPITFHKRLAQTDALTTLFQTLGISQVTVVPIAGNTFEGLLFAFARSSRRITQADLNPIESLARVTANVLERNLLIESIQDERIKLQEQTGRMEGVLHSIDEGIFFVGDDQHVVYCNPQFSELTGINPSQVLEKPYTELFHLLTLDALDKQTRNHLSEAVTQIEDVAFEGAYPIVELNTGRGDNLLVEFMRVSTGMSQSGWIAVINHQYKLAATDRDTKDSQMLYQMLENMSWPLIELNKTTMMLPEQYDLLSQSRFEHLLQNLEHRVRDIQLMWNNFVQIYRSKTSGIQVRTTQIDPDLLIQNLLTMRRMLVYSRQVRFETQLTGVMIDVDERQIRHSIINLVEFVSHVANQGAPIFVSTRRQGNQIVFAIHEKTTTIPDDKLNNVFSPERYDEKDDSLYPYLLGVYLAREIIEAHHGTLTISSGRGMGVIVKMALPLVSDAVGTTYEQLPDETEDPSNIDSRKPLTITILESQTRFLAELYGDIEAEGHQILQETRMNDVQLDLKMTKVDVVVLEVDQSNTEMITQLQRIRSSSEVPIVIVALPDYENECLQALKQGADDYFIIPFNEEKFLGQLHSLARRQELASRTAEPIIVSNLELDFSRRRIYRKGELLELTTKEYELLRVLVMNRGHVITHKSLLAKVWGPEYEDETQYLWVNISRLRRKLEQDESDPEYIQNAPRVGYMFIAD